MWVVIFDISINQIIELMKKKYIIFQDFLKQWKYSNTKKQKVKKRVYYSIIFYLIFIDNLIEALKKKLLHSLISQVIFNWINSYL